MNKRGQVTAFVIVGILILIVIGLLFYFRERIFFGELNQEDAERFVSARVEPVKDVVRNCVADKLMEGVRLVSWQGGYYDPVDYQSVCVDYDLENGKCLDEIKIGYACKSKANTLPLISFISKEIKQFIESSDERTELESCIKTKFDDFESEGLGLEYNFANLNLDDPVILPNKIRQDINFPITIKRSGYSTDFRDLSVDFESSLFDIYMIAADITNEECNGGEFEIDDYVWEHERGGDILAAAISNGPNEEGYKPWYLEGYNEEEDGEILRFHFLIEE